MRKYYIRATLLDKPDFTKSFNQHVEAQKKAANVEQIIDLDEKLKEELACCQRAHDQTSKEIDDYFRSAELAARKLLYFSLAILTVIYFTVVSVILLV